MWRLVKRKKKNSKTASSFFSLIENLECLEEIVEPKHHVKIIATKHMPSMYVNKTQAKLMSARNTANSLQSQQTIFASWPGPYGQTEKFGTTAATMNLKKAPGTWQMRKILEFSSGLENAQH